MDIEKELKRIYKKIGLKTNKKIVEFNIIIDDNNEMNDARYNLAEDSFMDNFYNIGYHDLLDHFLIQKNNTNLEHELIAIGSFLYTREFENRFINRLSDEELIANSVDELLHIYIGNYYQKNGIDSYETPSYNLPNKEVKRAIKLYNSDMDYTNFNNDEIKELLNKRLLGRIEESIDIENCNYDFSIENLENIIKEYYDINKYYEFFNSFISYVMIGYNYSVWFWEQCACFKDGYSCSSGLCDYTYKEGLLNKVLRVNLDNLFEGDYNESDNTFKYPTKVKFRIDLFNNRFTAKPCEFE